MVEVRRKDRETVAALARRFAKKVQYSGVLMTARSQQFRSRPASKAQKRKQALLRAERRKHYEQLRKLGKLE